MKRIMMLITVSLLLGVVLSPLVYGQSHDDCMQEVMEAYDKVTYIMDRAKSHQGTYMKATMEIEGELPVGVPHTSGVEIAVTSDYYYLNNQNMEFYRDADEQISIIKPHDIVYLGMSGGQLADSIGLRNAQLFQGGILKDAEMVGCKLGKKDKRPVQRAILDFKGLGEGAEYIENVFINTFSDTKTISSIEIFYKAGFSLKHVKLTYNEMKENYAYPLDQCVAYQALKDEKILTQHYSNYQIIDQRK